MDSGHGPPADDCQPGQLGSSLSMLLTRLTFRSKPLGVLRASCFGIGNAGCNGGVAAVLVLNRAAGGVPGKRRKFKGDYKASQNHRTTRTQRQRPPIAVVAFVSPFTCLSYFHCVATPLRYRGPIVRSAQRQCCFVRRQMDG